MLKPTDPVGCKACEESLRKPEEVVYRPVREAIEELKKHERKILGALKQKGGNERFMSSPGLVLRDLKIAIPSVLAQHLGTTRGLALDATTPPCTVVLPNGQRVRPSVSVRITDGKPKG